MKQETTIQSIKKNIVIHAPSSHVWEALTDPRQMKHWMGDPEMKVEVVTNWQAGHSIIIRGHHHGKFENKGTVLHFEPEKILKYDYLSSVSRLPDKSENHTRVEFRLVPTDGQTQLTLILSNFPTESIYRHVDFYWNGTLGILKRLVEIGDRDSTYPNA